MELTWAWMPLVLAGLLAIGVALRLILSRGRRRRSDADVVAAAHTERLTALPSYRRAITRGRILFGLLLVGVLVSLGGMAVAAGRPVTTSVERTDSASRDIVLCLDVSGSMLDSDAAVLSTFEDIAKGFHGERISLVIWNASAVPVFPLTDDYEYIDGQLQKAAKAAQLRGYSYDFDLQAGTLVGDGTGSSLVGDGLASCVLRFDNQDKQRSRTIVLATDNDVRGSGIVSLDEAVGFAKERSVRVYAIGPNPSGAQTSDELELGRQVERTGGKLYGLGDASASSEIVSKVLADQAAHLEGTPRVVVTDHPGAPLVLGILAFWLVVFIGWRTRS